MEQGDHLSLPPPAEAPGCEPQKLRTVFMIVVSAVALIALIVLAVALGGRRNTTVLQIPRSTCVENLITCPKSWLRFHKNCFYLSTEARTWEGSKSFCASLEATLSKITTKQELDLLKKQVGLFNFWIGLSRKKDSIWRWTDDNVFNSLFIITGGGECAYLDASGVKTASCNQPRRHLCSKAGFCRQKRGGIPHTTYGVERERT
ncbi:C-type lectin domain family 2 member A-like isoform X2 [Ornithorhynchus anatinus]|uniref:C-type lectin domain family 2 member A-like isoform X2 n=1 Tax=Ornithorhynchus anatinus TaxID=9258 RepID=UPI0010A8A102|nr:C-type lectin domain family 2 member A-like isoform X2 [Ornithorhynchus anatinus]